MCGRGLIIELMVALAEVEEDEFASAARWVSV